MHLPVLMMDIEVSALVILKSLAASTSSVSHFPVLSKAIVRQKLEGTSLSASTSIHDVFLTFNSLPVNFICYNLVSST